MIHRRFLGPRVGSAILLALYVTVASGGGAIPSSENSTAARPLTAWDKIVASWKEPVPARHLVGNIHYVGAAGVSSFLITTPDGHILLDTGFADTVPIIERGVRQLGFKMEDIRIILSSHAHFDHVEGHAEMQRRTGARIYASAADARMLAEGGAKDVIPLPAYEPVRVDRVIQDGEAISLGGTTLTALLTPGHTAGATTWTMNVRDGTEMYRVVFFSSASINPGTQLIGNPVYPSISDDLAATFVRLKTLPCDIFFAPHGSQFGMGEKFARLDQGARPGGVHPLVDPEGFKALIVSAEEAYQRTLAAEKGEAK